MAEFFRSEKVSSSITRIVDLAGVACYLIEGQERACLLDTCCGYGNIRTYVESLTGKPAFVILTHGHYDHTGGACFFDEVYMNPADLPVLKKHTLERKAFWEIDRQNIPTLEQVSYDSIHIYNGTPQPLRDGMNFDLGGVHVRMIHAQGHTPGMMCALVPEERIMFFGDACGMNVLLHDEFSSTASEYLRSLKRLKEHEDQYDTVYRNHGSFTNEKSLLDNVIRCAELIVAGQDDHVPVEMFHKTLYQAKQTGPNGRVDGKQGNILYAIEKRC